MPAPATVPGEGTLLQLGSGSPVTYTTISRRTVIDGPDLAIASVEDSDLDDSWHTYRPSQMAEGGKVSFSIWYNPTDTEMGDVLALITPPTANVPWQIVLPVGTHGYGVTFSGHLTKFAFTGMEIEKNLEAKCEIKVSGGVAVAALT